MAQNILTLNHVLADSIYYFSVNAETAPIFNTSVHPHEYTCTPSLISHEEFLFQQRILNGHKIYKFCFCHSPLCTACTNTFWQVIINYVPSQPHIFSFKRHSSTNFVSGGGYFPSVCFLLPLIQLSENKMTIVERWGHVQDTQRNWVVSSIRAEK